ncbi:MAG: hypothetical protein M3N07_06375 [Pseudomonadota bacterium]|nr:hypothetical protein [Pseudomonadota bacterium]
MEHIPGPGEVYFHGYPKVLVVPHDAQPPRLDRDGCITGRIAARNGALTLPTPRTVLTDDSPVDRDWYLHAQRPAQRR